jgi:hypothetical protein
VRAAAARVPPSSPPHLFRRGAALGCSAGVAAAADRTIYEWEQSLDEVNVFITPPEGVVARMLDVKIDVMHLKIGLKGNPPFLDVRACTALRSVWCAK